VKLLVEGANALGLTLTPLNLEAFQIYYQELVAWNERFNLTAITAYEEVQVRHFLDSLSSLLVIENLNIRVIDVGTGPGFPGLPLKILHPEMRLTLLESVGKKVRFLEHITRKLGLEGVEIIKGRAEKLGQDPSYREQFDLVLARAVAALPALLEYTLPFCRVGGIFLAHKGSRIQQELRTAHKALRLLGGSLREIRDLRPLGLDGLHSLVVIEKVCPTPNRYPRRPGIPAKRPLLD